MSTTGIACYSVLGLVLGSVLFYALYRLLRAGFTYAADYVRDARQDAATQRRLNQLARILQLGLLKLHLTPDFRRAASAAALALEVPIAFRKRQFHRFRERLIRHYAASLRAGTDPAILCESLVELLGHLGIPAFEAEYIRIAAERQVAVRVDSQPTYDRRLQEVHREHESRVAAINGMATASDEVKEQLLEAEENRYRDALMVLGQ
jgi:hypothetical protein